MGATQLDAAWRAEEPERSWLVVVGREICQDSRTPGGLLVDREANVTVTAVSMEIVDGALVFRDTQGELSWSFGPTGWLEVSRA